MLFNSLVFIELLTITFIIYYIPRLRNHQVLILILASLVFYAGHQPYLVLLLLFSALVNILSSYYVVYGNSQRRRAVATAGVVINLCGLAFFKYSPLMAATFFSSDDPVGRLLLDIPLPIGISFYTFEGISLLVDVWRGNDLQKQSIVLPSLTSHAKRTLFFISFFPHLIAGPILKARAFFPQIAVKRISDINWNAVFRALVTGYFLKMVVADNLKDYTYWIAYPYYRSQSGLTLITMLLGYSFQIFADFAGYSLIAIGLAKLFGYDLINNFNFPYISTSFREFWKRWNISLSSFLMEYLYIPLGGNKKGKPRTYLNLMITMILGGLWHGAAWSYAMWGCLHGLALALERILTNSFKIKHSRLINGIKGMTVFLFVSMAWLLFKLPHFSDVVGYCGAIVHNFRKADDTRTIAVIIVYSLPVILYHFCHLLEKSNAVRMIAKLEHWVYGLMLFLIIVNSGSSATFIYFQF